MKIRSKLIISILLIVLIGGGVALFFATQLSQEALKKSIGINSSSSAQQTIDSIDRIIYRRIERWESFIETRSSIVELLNKSNEQFEALDDRQGVIALRNIQWITATGGEFDALQTDWIDATLSENLRGIINFYESQYAYELYPEVFIANKYGVNIAQSKKTSQYYHADEEWWGQARRLGTYVIDASFDQKSGVYSLSLCIRISDREGNFIGVLKAVYNLEDIINVINDINEESGVELAAAVGASVRGDETAAVFHLVDGKGKIIYSTNSDQNQYLTPFPGSILNGIANSGNTKYFIQTDNTNGEEKLYAFAYSNGYLDYTGLNWVSIYEYKTSDIYTPVDALGKSILGVIAGSSTLAIIIGLFVAGYITRPIGILRKSTEIIKKGNLNHKAAITTRDEIGDFSRAFDQMTEAIKESRKDIDTKVKDQTREITRQRDKLNVQKRKAVQYANDLKKYQLAVESASDHIIITDPDGIILYANKGFERITGFSVKEVIGRNAGNHVWGKQMPRGFYKQFWHRIKVQKKPYTGEITNTRKNGEIYDAAISVAPVLDSKGNVEYFVGIGRDITKEKQIDKAKTEFVSLASHQLRTPLTAINWYAELLIAGDAGKLTKKQHSFLKEIILGNKRMIDLVNSLLNVSRIELGTFIIEPKISDINKIAAVVIKELLPQIKMKKQKFIKKVTKGVSLMKVDSKLLSIIFQNLLSNAIKYTPEKGSINLTIGKDSKNIIIQVSDSGYGIPKDQQSKIFTKLFRADNIQSKDTKGTGLGLYIIKSILDHSGGTIKFISKENRGSTFTVTIPLSGMKAKRGVKVLN